jgi:hypothetical protein
MLQVEYQAFKMIKMENPPGYTDRGGCTKRLIRQLVVQLEHLRKVEDNSNHSN